MKQQQQQHTDEAIVALNVSQRLSRCVGKILVTVSKNIIHNNQSYVLDYFASKFDNFLLDKNF